MDNNKILVPIMIKKAFLAVIAILLSAASLCHAGIEFQSAIPTKTITIDGYAQDWAGISTIIDDPQGDSITGTERDLKALYLAKDASYIYWRIDTWTGNYPENGMIVSFLGDGAYEIKNEVWSDGSCNFFKRVGSVNYQGVFSGGQEYAKIVEIAEGKFPVSLFDDHSFDKLEAIYTNWNSGSGAGTDYATKIFSGNTISTKWYLDFDGDGYGDAGNSMNSDSKSGGYVLNSSDCNDNDININPGANDTCGDGIDQDCSGSDKTCTSSFSTDPASLSISKYNTADFDINGGSGFYNIASNDKSIATIVLTENNVAQVTGKSEGTTTITVTDSNGESTSVNVNVTQVVKAIIVAGSGPYTANYLWDSTLAVTKYAYNVPQSQGFTNDTIAYYAESSFIDVDGDGKNDVDGDAANSSLKTAVTGWAADAKDVLIYMTGHGSDGKFKMGEFEHLKADVLNTWIKSLESKIPGKVTFAYDACQSGSFVSSLVPEPGTTRIMLFSASKGENAYFTSLGAISFSNLFWTQIHNGADIKDAFINAKNSIEYAYTSQTPILDDNSNGIGNDSQDGENTEGEFFGNGVVSAGDLPSIASISPSKVLKTDTSATIYADNVTDIDGIAEVWAVITPPDSYSSDPDNPVVSLPVLAMNDVGSNRYEGVYTEFTKKGNYNIAVFAKDTNGNISIPKSTAFIQSKGESHVLLDSALAMTIPCVEFQGTCYQITLDSYVNPSDSSGFFWKLDINSIGTNQTCGSDSASMDIDLNMTIPKIEYKGNFYQIQLKKHNNLNDPFGNYWKLDPASVKALTNEQIEDKIYGYPGYWVSPFDKGTGAFIQTYQNHSKEHLTGQNQYSIENYKGQKGVWPDDYWEILTTPWHVQGMDFSWDDWGVSIYAVQGGEITGITLEDNSVNGVNFFIIDKTKPEGWYGADYGHIDVYSMFDNGLISQEKLNLILNGEVVDGPLVFQGQLLGSTGDSCCQVGILHISTAYGGFSNGEKSIDPITLWTKEEWPDFCDCRPIKYGIP